jgi:hypothetical protein
VAHPQEVHRRMVQDLPEHRPGEFRPDAPGHFKNRELEASGDRVMMPCALRPEIDRNLALTLDALQDGRGVNGIVLTEDGEKLLRIGQAMSEDAECDLSHSTEDVLVKPGQLTMACTEGIGTLWLTPRLSRLQAVSSKNDHRAGFRLQPSS